MFNFWHMDEIMSENFSGPVTSSGRDCNYCCSFEILPEIARVVCEKSDVFSISQYCPSNPVDMDDMGKIYRRYSPK